MSAQNAGPARLRLPRGPDAACGPSARRRAGHGSARASEAVGLFVAALQYTRHARHPSFNTLRRGLYAARRRPAARVAKWRRSTPVCAARPHACPTRSAAGAAPAPISFETLGCVAGHGAKGAPLQPGPDPGSNLQPLHSCSMERRREPWRRTDRSGGNAPGKPPTHPGATSTAPRLRLQQGMASICLLPLRCCFLNSGASSVRARVPGV